MSVDDLSALLDFEQGLREGLTVELRWTNNNGYYSGKATLSKVNRKSARGVLIEQAQREDYKPGREIWVERFGSPRWSRNNGIFPVAK